MNDTPRRDISPIVLPELGGPSEELWTLLLDIAERLTAKWSIVGGQMVMLHGLENGRAAPRVSADIDAVVDLRTDQAGLSKLVAVLTDLGLEPVAEPGPNGLMHKYARPNSDASVDVAVPPTEVDVLVPEGLGPAAKVETSLGGRAFAAPGTTQALDRTELVPVTFQGRIQSVPRPNLLGAIVGKSVARVADDKDPERHARDLAFLLSLVQDPSELKRLLTPKDQKRLRLAAQKLTMESPAWEELQDYADDARDAWRILVKQ